MNLMNLIIAQLKKLKKNRTYLELILEIYIKVNYY